MWRLYKKFKKLIPNELWHKLPILFVMMVVAGFMEMLSVSLMLPFMNIVVNRKDEENWYIKLYRNAFHIESDEVFLISISLIMASMYIIKGIFLIWEIRYQERFVGRARFETQKKVMTYIIDRPYEFFLDKSTAKVLTLLGYVLGAYDLLTTILNLLAESFTSFCLIITLFVITPKISMLMATGLLVLLLGITKILKPRIRTLSKKNKEALTGMNKWLMQSVQGIKAVKIEGSRNYFIANFDKSGKTYANTNCDYIVLSSVPRMIIEAVTMSAFFTTIAIHISNGRDLSQMIPVISVIAMAALRLIPTTNRMSGAISNIAYYEPYVDEVLEYLQSDSDSETEEYMLDRTNSNIDSYDSEIVLKDVTYCYPNNEEPILNEASIGIKKGESIGIVGSSGAGKTTAVDIMLGLLKPQSGKVEVDGIDINKDIEGWYSMIGYIPQNIFMLDDTIRANVAFGIDKDCIDDNKVWQALNAAALDGFTRSLPKGLDTQLGERGMRLSGGQIQRIGIARALYKEPEILFFDEATSALDNETEKEIMEAVNRLKGQKTMIIIAHRLTTIQSCDHIYRVENGKIIKER